MNVFMPYKNTASIRDARIAEKGYSVCPNCGEKTHYDEYKLCEKCRAKLVKFGFKVITYNIGVSAGYRAIDIYGPTGAVLEAIGGIHPRFIKRVGLKITVVARNLGYTSAGSLLGPWGAANLGFDALVELCKAEYANLYNGGVTI